ncbi:MAG: ribose-phosphate pyrophosphokinase [Muribaculaceae bacterium]|nr:ribose-phosphate pyrophosphokinase [Muribaculaceae bacterium]
MAEMKIFSGTKSQYVAEKIAKELGMELGKIKISHFADGEFEVCYEEPVRGAEIYLIQSTFSSSENLMELLLMIDAAKRASAQSVIAVIPYFGWARQDRKDKPRVSIAAKLVANILIAAGIDRLITMDLHADQIQGFFDVPVDHLYASTMFVPDIEKLNLDNLVIASPDVGGAKRANSYAKYFNAPLVLCHKQRLQANVVENMTIIGDVKDKNVILIDDMVDTAGTICKAASLMKENGARSVRAYISHAVMSNPASERVMASGLDELVISDSIPFDTAECPKVRILSLDKMFAHAIKHVNIKQSINDLFLFK